MHTVAVLALDKVVPFDLSTPIDVFSRSRLPDGRAAYRVRVCGLGPQVDAGTFTLQPPWGLEALATADTIMLPGCSELTVVPTADHTDPGSWLLAAGSFHDHSERNP
jgi:hypothetical protein